ncbi:MAG TPA: TlpA disulfide reductase family protein [Candidatus Polarisedimenticolaceae bacterium]|nr:TlpA disulfide reductase family protein [Candidatus Polarisedimenticolaceae bacterium]
MLPISALIAGFLAVTAPPPAAATADTVLREVRRPGASVTLVNLWATWCQPCREEFPDLLRLRRAYQARGLRLVLVNADFGEGKEEAVKFLADQGVDFPTLLKDQDDDTFINALGGGWSGALPATFVFDGTGRLVELVDHKATYATLESKIRPFLREEGKETTR